MDIVKGMSYKGAIDNWQYDEEEYAQENAVKSLQRALSKIPQENQYNYLVARLYTAEAFSNVLNKDISYMDALVVDSKSDILFQEQVIISKLLNLSVEKDDLKKQEQFIQESSVSFGNSISDEFLGSYGWTQKGLQEGIEKKATTKFLLDHRIDDKQIVESIAKKRLEKTSENKK